MCYTIRGDVSLALDCFDYACGFFFFFSCGPTGHLDAISFSFMSEFNHLFHFGQDVPAHPRWRRILQSLSHSQHWVPGLRWEILSKFSPMDTFSVASFCHPTLKSPIGSGDDPPYIKSGHDPPSLPILKSLSSLLLS